MTIAGSSVQLSSQSVSIIHEEASESLRMWVGDRRPDFCGRGPHGDTVRLSEAGTEEELRQAMLVRLIELPTGKKLYLRLFSMKDLETGTQTGRAGFGLEYDRKEVRFEAEKTTFQAAGVVKTGDGREIAFTVDLSMSRQYLSERSLSLRYGDAVLKDPLVLNFAGKAAVLTTTRYSFDIDTDADGQAERIPFVGPDSGFLALDRNGDGVVNDGSELFGAASGQGFADLARYDDDGNRWIDAGDSVYQRLLVWSKDAEGRDRLAGLAALGVGAIHLDQVATPFSIKDGDNALLGRVAATGIFLQEDGQAGVVQQIDLSV